MTTMESDQPDATTQWHVLTDRSQGATKIRPDELEIMVHRRLFKVSKYIGHNFKSYFNS